MCKDLVCSRSRTYWTWSAVSTYLWQHPSGCGCGSCYGLCSCNDQRRPLWLFLSPENSSLWLDICHPSDIFPVLFPVLYVNRRSRSRPYNQHQVKYICKGGSQTLQRWCWRFEVKDEKLTKDKRFLRKEEKKTTDNAVFGHGDSSTADVSTDTSFHTLKMCQITILQTNILGSDKG